MGKMLLLFLVLIFAAACNANEKYPDVSAEKGKILDYDRAFSEQSEKRGMKQAFIDHLDGNAVLLRPGSMPLEGADALDFFVQMNDSSYTMNWRPQHAEISQSGDLGYTYGVYAIHQKSKDSTVYGTYVNVWKKQASGNWKLVLETANEGIDNQ